MGGQAIAYIPAKNERGDRIGPLSKQISLPGGISRPQRGCSTPAPDGMPFVAGLDLGVL